VSVALICATCGAKLRPDRDRCPRCRAVVTVSDPAKAAAASQRLLRASAVLVGMFAVVLIALWLRGALAPVHPPAGATDRLAGGRQTPPAQSEGTLTVAPAAQPEERTFLDAAGTGAVAYGSGNYVSALEQYQTAVERNPQDAESLSNLGQVLVRLNRAREAIPYFHRAIELIPNRWAYQFNLARAEGLSGQRERSIAAYRRAQELFPDDPVTTFNLALALHKKGDEAAAVVEYQKAIAGEPLDASFRMALAQSYERLQKPAEAVSAYQEALRLAPEAVDADQVRARIAQLTAGRS